MAKALTTEDLLYILQSVFRLSNQPNNAFQMLDDGLFVDDYDKWLTAHSIDANLHIDEELRNILNGFSVDEDGNLLYNSLPVNVSISAKDHNAILIEQDGLYVEDVSQEVKTHIADDVIHVTKDDKEKWNNILQSAKDLIEEKIKDLFIYNYQVVTTLPEENISARTIYLVSKDPDCPDELDYVSYMYIDGQWTKQTITEQTLRQYALLSEVKDAIDNEHDHPNKEILDKLSEGVNQELLYNGVNIFDVNLSDEPNNAAQMIDGKLYVKDYTQDIKDIQRGAAFAKVSLYAAEEIIDSGVYELKDYIDNYNLLLVEYYYRPDDESQSPGCAKTAVIDVDVINELYEKGMDYMLEYGYGILTSNSKIRMHEDKIWVDYYHNVCIYKITGIRKGE